MASLADASTFTDLAEVKMRRRRMSEAKEASAVMDGADWCITFTERHRPDAVRILDFPLAAEHLTQLLKALEKAGMHFPPHMLDRCLHLLKHRGPRPLLRMADRLERNRAQQKGVQEHLEYLRKREALMQYPQFHSLGWPIGSGMVGEWGECQQKRRRSSPQGNGDALGAQPCQSHARITHCHLQ